MVDWLHLHEHIHAYYCLHKQNTLLKYKTFVFLVFYIWMCIAHSFVKCNHTFLYTFYLLDLYWLTLRAGFSLLLHFMLVFYLALHCAIASLHTRRHDRSAFILEVNWPNFQCSCFTLESWCSLRGEGQERGRSHINSHNSFISLDKKSTVVPEMKQEAVWVLEKCTVVTAAI